MRVFWAVSYDGFTAILDAGIFQMSFHAHSGEVDCFGDDAGDSSIMVLESRFWLVFFIVFYDLLDAVWFSGFCRV